MRSFAVVLVCSVSGSLLLGCDAAPVMVDASVVSVPDAAPSPDAGFVADAFEIPDASTESPDAPLATADALIVADTAPAHCGSDAGGDLPTFRELYADVIGPYRCAECHGPTSTWPTALDLSSVEVAYSSLIGVTGCDGLTPRVTPCDPAASTLALVPTGRAEPCGGRHTYSGVFPTGIVTPEERDRIDAWIAAGAAY